MFHHDKAMYKYLRFLSVICILFGVVVGFGEIQQFSDPNYSININGVERSDAEAKLISLFIPMFFIIAGVVLNKVSYKDVKNVRKARSIVRSILKK